MKIAVTLTLLALITGCGGKKDKDDDGGEASSAFTVPDYTGEPEPPATYATDVAAFAADVARWQGVGKKLAAAAAANGKLVLDDDKVVQLTAISRNACPEGLSGCNDLEADALGIGAAALVAPTELLSDSIRDQGDRGTCVSFALSGAVEILLARQGRVLDLSEQNTYLLAKQTTGSWDSSGLNPVDTVKGFVDGGLNFAAEDSWPYNPIEKSCEAYSETHPGHTCSATEAQGGGADGREPDPAALAAPVGRVTQGHQLYASVGRVKQALYRGYPVVLGVNANIDFSIASKKQGVVSWVFKQTNCGESVCGHAVLAVGYQDDPSIAGGGYVVIKNSWDTSWGRAGFAYLTYEWLQNSILDAQAIVAAE